jgi:hypothetical protein
MCYDPSLHPNRRFTNLLEDLYFRGRSKLRQGKLLEEKMHWPERLANHWRRDNQSAFSHVSVSSSPTVQSAALQNRAIACRKNDCKPAGHSVVFARDCTPVDVT